MIVTVTLPYDEYQKLLAGNRPDLTNGEIHRRATIALSKRLNTPEAKALGLTLRQDIGVLLLGIIDEALK